MMPSPEQVARLARDESGADRPAATAPDAPSKYVTLAEAARRIGYAKKTLMNKYERGELGKEQGVFKPFGGVSSRIVVDWELFEATMVRRG